MRFWVLFLFVFLSSAGVLAGEPQCGKEVGDKLCDNDLCCSSSGYCGLTEAYCGKGCQSNCHLPPGNISYLINQTTFDEMFKHRSDDSCDGSTIYTYDAFIEAATHFGGFGRTGDNDTRKREIAAFLAQTAYATAGGPEDSEDPYSWGYCYVEEQNATSDYCVESTNWPCVEGQKYYGRGPIQLRYNTYYGPAGLDLDYALLFDPDELTRDSVMSFKSALWYWMNCHFQKPSCHSVMTNQWVPNPDDVQAGRVAGFGLTTNIIDGENECGHGIDGQVEKRIGFYEAFCDLIGVTYGDNLDCYTQEPYGSSFVSKIYKAISKIFKE